MCKLRKILYVSLSAIMVLLCVAYGVQGIRSSVRVYPAIFGYNRAFPMWFCIKATLRDGLNPYSKEGQMFMEELVFGRPLKSDEKHLVMDKQYFVYPLYVCLVYFPTLLFDASNALAILWVVSLVMALSATRIWAKMIWIDDSRIYWIALTIMFLSWPHTYLVLQSRQPQMFVLFFISLAIYLIRRHRSLLLQVFAGVLFFFSTIKPQSSLLISLYCLCLWLPLIGPRKRAIGVWLGFIGSALISLSITLWLVPGWPVQFLRAIWLYRDYAGRTGLEALCGKGGLSIWVSILLFVIGIAISCTTYRSSDRGIFSICYWLVTQGLVFPAHSYVVIMVLPSVMLVIRELRARYIKGDRYTTIITGMMLCLCLCGIYLRWVDVLFDSEFCSILSKSCLEMIRLLPRMHLYSPLIILEGILLIIFARSELTSRKDDEGLEPGELRKE